MEKNPKKVDGKDKTGRTPLVVAAENDYLSLVTWLIDEKGAQVHGVKPLLEGPLSHAGSGEVGGGLASTWGQPSCDCQTQPQVDRPDTAML